MRAALTGFVETLGNDRAHMGSKALAEALLAARLATEAEELCRSALQARRSALGVGHPDSLASASLLGECLAARGAAAEAEGALRESLAGQVTALGDSHLDTAASTHALGCLLLVRGAGAARGATASAALASAAGAARLPLPAFPALRATAAAS